jgi:chromosome segregation ATPase
MDFDSCTIDFSDTDFAAATAVPHHHQHQQDELPWPPIFQNNCCWGVKDISTAPIFSRGNFSSYASFMDACKREETIEELINQQNILKKEVVDLHRQNFMLESEKEKLINDLINFGITENNCGEMEDDETQTVETTTKEDSAKKDALIEELEAKLLEAQERCAKLEKENGEYSEKVFEMDIEKQRINIKLHHYTNMSKNFEENNGELEKEIKKLKTENSQLLTKLEKLEEKIERMEEGDFEHVNISHDESAIPTVILI